MAFTFDGVNLRITLESGVPTLDTIDLYSRWKDWVKTDNNSKYPIAFSSEAGAPVTGALDQAAYIRLRNDNGWRLRPPEENINILVEGNLIPGDDTLDIVVPTLGAFTALVLGLQPIAQATAGSSPTAIASAVWSDPSAVNLKEDMVRMLGLVNENTVWSNMTWDTSVAPPRILSGKITAYTDNTLGTPLTDGGGTIAWQIDQTYNPDGSTATLTYKRVFA